MSLAQLKLAAIALALAFVGASYVTWRSYEREQGAAAFVNRGLKAENDSLKGQVARDSLALQKRDTALVFRTVRTQDTILQRIIDTAIVHHRDTVTVTREVLVEVKAALDSTKGVANACCMLARDLGSRNRVLDSLYRNAVAAQPSLAQRRLAVTVGYGCSEAAGKGQCGPAVVAGLRLWPEE